MDGLECSEIKLNEVFKADVKFRIDSEYYSKEYTKAYKTIKKIPHVKMNDALEILTDFHSNGSYATIAKNFKLLDEKNYAYMVRSTDLEKKDYMDDVKYIDKNAYNFLEKSKVFGGEVLINKIGTPGKTYLMPRLDRKVSLGMNLFMLRCSEKTNINNEFLYIFLNTKIGKKIIERKINGAVPLTIDKDSIRSVIVPIFSTEFNNIIKDIVNMSEMKTKESKELYLKAEKLLLKELKLNDFPNTKKQFYSVKSFSESFINGRLDAEYYQPQYTHLIESVKSLEHLLLSDIVKIKKSIEPGSQFYQEVGVPFIRVSDITKYGLSKPDIYLPTELAQKHPDLKPKKNTILFTKDGTIGIAYKVEDDMVDTLTSSAILHLTIKNRIVNPDYLTLILNSQVVQMQAERDGGGSVIKHWRMADIEKVLIPIIDNEKQEVLADKVKVSFELMNSSNKLIDIAITGVEKAIETDENTATKWVNEELKKFNLA